MIGELFILISGFCMWCVLGYFGLVVGVIMDLEIFSKHSTKYDTVIRWKLFLGISLGPIIWLWPIYLGMRFLIQFIASGRILEWLKEEID